MSSSTTPLKYASSTDYTLAVIVFTSVLLVLSTLAVCARCYVRWAAKNVPLGVDNAFAVLGWVRSQRSVPLLYMLLIVDSLVSWGI